ncbi:MFS transporter [Brevibacillus daliensis]|uniref:MFS transporter n=1 Tax=Brevibacillus daliensis TaxID=2892995 RepID=UPI001E445AD9|nr:MFS transporter [Brevibacillus daliensis]
MSSQENQTAISGQNPANVYFALSGLYLFLYYSMGAYSPLLTEYFNGIGFSGTQIGILASITPVVSLLLQPVWGIVCDRFQIRKKVLLLNLMLAALALLAFTAVTSYAWVFFFITVFSIFQCAVVPISDSLTLSYTTKRKMQFGNIRLWGAVGFSIAAFFTALAVDRFGPSAIFYSASATFLIAILFLFKIPDEKVENRGIVTPGFKGAGELLRIPRYSLFLVSAFFMYGSINAHNTWFNIYYQHIGGELASLGFAFLLFAGSEVPAMKMAYRFINRLGLEKTLLLACTISACRWLFYGTAPSTTVILGFFFLQGLSVGLFLATAAQFVRENTPVNLQVTALAVFSSIGIGLGSMFANFFAGVIMDNFGILYTYTFFGVATSIGVIPLLLICYGPFRNKKPMM